MKMNELTNTLLESGVKILNPSDFEFAKKFLEDVSAVKLAENSIAAGFFMKADTKNPTINQLITEKFGKKTIDEIELLQRISKITFPETQKNIGQLRKLFIELSDDISIIFVKLTERLVNLKIANNNNTDDLYNLSEEALYFYSPIAQMLGIRKIYTELEDIAFKNLFPDDFHYLDKMIEQKKNEFNAKLNLMKSEIEKTIVKYNIKAKIQARVKRPYSIYRKLVKQKISLDKIFDLLALRVITDSPENCYLTLGIVHSNWIPIENRFRDWITYPKANGYRSIQTTVHTRTGDKFEIQIRTEEMHQEAEYGSSAHWAYKQSSTSVRDLWVNRLREFLENDEYFDNPHQIIDRLKSEIRKDYINILTPKGEIKSLPEKSTPIDYAFSVHTDLGFKITGARVNGKFVKLNTELKSGDVIDIITSNNATPSRDWLNIVKTSKARSKILKWFKKNEEELLIIDGRNKWERVKDKYRKKLIGFDDEQKFKNNLNKFGFKTYDEFFRAVSGGAVKATLFTLKKLYPDAFKKATDDNQRKGSGISKSSLPKIKIEGMSNISTVLSKCCNPIKGEPIIAYITKKSELKIHSLNCPLIANHDQQNENYKKAEWADGESLQLSVLKIYGNDYGKMLTTVVECANAEKVRIISTSNITKPGVSAGILLEIEVKDYAQLQAFMTKLKSSVTIDLKLVKNV